MRQLVILSTMPPTQGGVLLNSQNFSKAKQFLGQEYPFALYDMRSENGICFNLEAFAIIVGTIQENGTLYLICPNWHSVEQQIDVDAIRWNGGVAIACPHFFQHFKRLINKFGFEVTSRPQQPFIKTASSYPTKLIQFTDEQQNILQKLPLDPAEIHIITAARGRGKSTLAGKLAEQFAKTEQVILTAHRSSSIQKILQTASINIPFFAPDKLLNLIETKQISADHLLFIDEAACIPLPILQQLGNYFKKVILTTTTQNYEGTGRGFKLKLVKQLHRTTKEWQLFQPLRWSNHDRLEQFTNELLLLNDELIPLDQNSQFYHLLANAHYKTTATDLRRLFDADQQLFHQCYDKNQRLMAGIWAVKEGELSQDLAEAIWASKRRPAGNLVAQYLCCQGNLIEACQLKSIRISRIAVQPDLQNQGIGSQLVNDFMQKMQKNNKNRPLDFISVSFGITLHLLTFWRRNGFQLVQITPTKEASSGYHSAMMLYPLSQQGKQFVTKAVKQFERDLALQPFYPTLKNCLAIPAHVENEMNQDDWQNLHGFAFAQRSLANCYTSLKRLYITHQAQLTILAPLFTHRYPANQKVWIQQCRIAIRPFIQ
ncbi:GNAT family N-acetyltransferase [[Haemophilus] ducreyi]|uniref:GNAT family N-acetyltransferase n=1 Tax=Haemophilus ducreyi TaxID=730 RepID=UPI0006555516|nr:GNAT family N-acetyltransferase [[Haemophilus] ducreyi]AKO45597.1 tRNA(Met) cytidine acetyltransferase [[Haemophilus] ducreyi]AKO46983.1 tRNA(Met) cytidine acetyltransferase [[Haemophilus] ducreyi]AKO48327.1 tRNA(Met) cytidine acetyltransferase [[Haemophilus] ducreyi]AKO49715.1 tRNA(Met) cytidine acetyltransferase [[Haemophilus] ducreyi]ANF61319.1 tRNA(Met) cytidine acetyltransferase [[Haemophilus] ducreyi]